MELIESIKHLGLSETESKIYLTLLKFKKCSVITLSKEIDVHRRSIYDNLNLLIKKGLVNYKIDGKTKIFEATDPKNLKAILEEKNKILEEVFPSLNSLYLSEKNNLDINIYHGDKSLKFLMQDAHNTKGTKYWIGSGYEFFKKTAYSIEYIREKVSTWDVLAVQPYSDDLDELREGDYMGPHNLKILPDSFKTDTGVITYGNKVGIAIFSEFETHIIIIDNIAISKLYKAQFDFLWQFAKPFKLKKQI